MDGFLWFVAILSFTGWVAADVWSFSREEWEEVSEVEGGRTMYGLSPLLLFACGAGLFIGMFYAVRIAPRLRKARAGEEVNRTLGQELREKMLVGDLRGTLQRLGDDLERKLAEGKQEFGLQLSEAGLRTGHGGEWSAVIDTAVARVEQSGCEVVRVSEVGQPGGRRLTITVRSEFQAIASTPARVSAGGESLASDVWLRAGEARYEELVPNYYGSPESIAAGGTRCLERGDVAAGLFFFQKAIDVLHTIYVINESSRREPGEGDRPIIDGYLAALERVRQERPEAPVEKSVSEVTHRLRTISTALQETGRDPSALLMALDRLAGLAPEVDVSAIFWKNPPIG